MNRVAPCLFLAAAASLAASASAQDFSVCRDMENKAERLACYDRIAGRGAVDEVQAIPAANTTAAAEPDGAPVSLLGRAWELDESERGQTLRLRPYKPVYVLPFSYGSQLNRFPNTPNPGHASTSPAVIDHGELKFQISLKVKMLEDVFGNNGDLWFGYTQSSHWQVFSGVSSRPFRETNYEPEAMLVWRTNYQLGGWRGRMLALSLNHQSNGQSLPQSRGWNRVIGNIALEKDEWTVALRPWWRIPENASQDDNPDISNYLGRGDLQLIRSFGGHQLALTLRHNLRGGSNSHGAAQLEYAFPIAGSMRGHLQWFSGYGESLIDYNHRSNYYGVGVSMLEWY